MDILTMVGDAIAAGDNVCVVESAHQLSKR